MSMKVSPIKRREPLRRKQLTAKMPVHFDVEEKRGKKIIVSKVPRKSPDKTNSNIKTLKAENAKLKKKLDDFKKEIDKEPSYEKLESENEHITLLLNRVFEDLVEHLMNGERGMPRQEAHEYIWDFLVHYKLLIKERLKQKLSGNHTKKEQGK